MDKNQNYKGLCTNCEEEVVFERILKPETFTVKGEPIDLNMGISRCTKCGDKVIDPNMNPDPFDQAYRVYRKNHNYLQPEDIKNWRTKFSFTQSEFAKILGLGITTLNRYENGTLQNEAHERLLRLAMEIPNLIELVKRSEDVFSNTRKNEILKKILDSEDTIDIVDRSIISNVRIPEISDIDGYVKLNVSKLINAILFYAQKGILKTKLNKLLFYTDFKHFKEYSLSITGLRYAHLPFGPTPDNFEMYYAILSQNKLIEFVEEIYTPEIIGEKIYSKQEPDLNLFTTSELRIMSAVKEDFESFNAAQIKDYSHQEIGYKETKNGELINYSYAIQLNY